MKDKYLEPISYDYIDKIWHLDEMNKKLLYIVVRKTKDKFDDYSMLFDIISEKYMLVDLEDLEKKVEFFYETVWDLIPYMSNSTTPQTSKEIGEGLHCNMNESYDDESSFTRGVVAITLCNCGIFKRCDPTIKKGAYLISEDYKDRIKYIFDEINAFKSACSEINSLFKISNDIDKVMEECNKKYAVSNQTKKLEMDKEKIIEYLTVITDIYSNLFSFKDRYNTLLKRSKYYEEKCVESIINVKLGNKEKIEFVLSEIDKLNSELKQKPEKNEKITIDYPDKPVFQLVKPEEPAYKKSSIFNKGKVENFNKELKDEYIKKVNDYNFKLEKYNKQIEEYNHLIEKLEIDAKNKNEEAYKIECEKFKEKCEHINEEIAEKNKEIAELSKTNIKELENNEEFLTLKSICYELNYIITCINSNYEVLNQLYSYNVIYDKYREFVPVSCFIDYLKSSRCETLDTMNGAYNLFEQECRADIIINKLDVIIDKLEQIKNNQYYLYCQLEDIKKSVSSIHNDLLVNNLTQVVQIGELSKIINNTNEIAYNTKVTAFYSEKISKYTKATAIMNFLDRL